VSARVGTGYTTPRGETIPDARRAPSRLMVIGRASESVAQAPRLHASSVTQASRLCEPPVARVSRLCGLHEENGRSRRCTDLSCRSVRARRPDHRFVHARAALPPCHKLGLHLHPYRMSDLVRPYGRSMHSRTARAARRRTDDAKTQAIDALTDRFDGPAPRCVAPSPAPPRPDGSARFFPPAAIARWCAERPAHTTADRNRIHFPRAARR